MHNRLRIYRNVWHLLITFLVIILPLGFLFFFTSWSHIELTGFVFQLISSFGRLVVAYGISAVLAIFFAVTLGRGKLGDLMLPVFDVLQSFPTFAALPLAIRFLGTSYTTVVVFLVLTVIWPILFSVVSSLRLSKKEWEEAVKMSHLSGRDYFRYFVWPLCIPGLITGSVIGLGEGWEALIATEIIVKTKPGLGEFFQSHSGEVTITALGILAFLLIIFSINKLVWLPMLERSHEIMSE